MTQGRLGRKGCNSLFLLGRKKQCFFILFYLLLLKILSTGMKTSSSNLFPFTLSVNLSAFEFYLFNRMNSHCYVVILILTHRSLDRLKLNDYISCCTQALPAVKWFILYLFDMHNNLRLRISISFFFLIKFCYPIFENCIQIGIHFCMHNKC